MEIGTTMQQYKILQSIGKGGMGEVYLAQDTKLNRRVAIKFLNEDLGKDVEKLNRFIQEARAASALNHPNILTVFEIGETESTSYIVTEYIEGKTLREHLSPDHGLSIDRILKIAVQVAEALAAAHKAGIIHRDIKPENIMIREDGYVKVLDFGLAKLLRVQNADSDRQNEEKETLIHSPDGNAQAPTPKMKLTNPGMVMGTVSYMSPEQSRGKETDARTDIWSLGVVLYEMLASKLPFTGETINHTIVSILEKEPKTLENVPDELQRIVRKTLTKDREMRYQSTKDLLIDLINLIRNLDIQGELERSIVPDRTNSADQISDNETQVYAGISTETTNDPEKRTQNITTSSSLEYAVTQVATHKYAAVIGGIVLLGAISAAAYFGFFTSSNKQIDSIAVMPFQNKSGETDSDFLSDGLTEALVYRLSKIPDLKVSPVSSVIRYKALDTDVAQIAKELGVAAVMYGRVTRRGEDLTISTELIDAANNKILWGEQYERKMSELLTTQREIATEITNRLKLKLSGESEQKLAKNYTESDQAYQLYLRGRYHFAKRSSDDMRKSIDFYQQAINLDPNFAVAYVGISNAYHIMAAASDVYGDFVDYEGTNAKGMAAARRALEIDPNLADAHTALASCLSVDWKWEEAESEFRIAVDLDPGSTNTHYYYGIHLGNIGQTGKAITEIERAVKSEPMSLIMNLNLAGAYMFDRQNERALEIARKTYELDPKFPAARRWLSYVLVANGNYSEALALSENDPEPWIIRFRGYAYAKTGRRAEAEQVIKKLKAQDGEGFSSALIFGALGEMDKAFAELENAVATRDSRVRRLKIDPLLDPLRSDPRFNELIKRMHFPDPL